jgi:hypothetical protein
MKPDSERIASYLAGELSPIEVEAFEREMEANPVLRAEVESLRGVLGEVREWMLTDAPGSERGEMEPPVSFPRRQESMGTSGSHWRYVIQALAACLVFFLGYALGIATTAPPLSEDLAPPPQQVAHLPQVTPAPSMVPAAIDEPTPAPPKAAPAFQPVRTQAVDEGGRLGIETTLAGSTSRAVWVVDGNFRLEQPGT